VTIARCRSRDFHQEMEAFILQQNPEFTFKCTSLWEEFPSMKAEADEAITEAQLAEDTASDAKLQECVKKVKADQGMWLQYLADLRQDSRTRHSAEVFHHREMVKLGEQVAASYMGKRAMFHCHKGEGEAVRAVVSLVRQPCFFVSGRATT